MKLHVADTVSVMAAALGWDRALIGVASIAGITVLGITGNVASEAVVGVYTLVIGYVLGRSAETGSK